MRPSKLKQIKTVNTKLLNIYIAFSISFLLLFLCSATSSLAKENILQLLEKEFKKVVAAAHPAVVKVLVTQHASTQFSPNISKITMARQDVSSGIIFDKDGHIVTTTFDIIPQ